MNLFKYYNILLWSLAAGALIIIIYIKSETFKKSALKRIFSPDAHKKLTESSSLLRRKIKNRFFVAALFLTFAAAAGPQWGVEFSPVGEISGNIAIAVDTSLSMLAKDLKPSRIENSKLMIKSLLSFFDRYRTGLVAFSGKAFVQCPLTTDKDALNYFISSLSVGMIKQKGTDLSEAIEKCVDMLKKHSGEKTAIIITDGEDFSKNLETAADYAKENNVRLFTVGIGSLDGELIPLTDENGNPAGYKKDKSGKTVITRLNEKVLKDIASQTAGGYIRYSHPEIVAQTIYKNASAEGLSETKFSSRATFKNRYQFVLFIALLLLLLEFILPENKISWKNIFQKFKRK